MSTLSSAEMRTVVDLRTCYEVEAGPWTASSQFAGAIFRASFVAGETAGALGASSVT